MIDESIKLKYDPSRSGTQGILNTTFPFSIDGLYGFGISIAGPDGDYYLEVSIDDVSWIRVTSIGTKGKIKVQNGLPAYVNIVDLTASRARLTSDLNIWDADIHVARRFNP